jgi:hypothetical protein
MWPLIVTSTCFIIPAIRGIRKGRKVIPIVNTVTAVASVNFWRDPKPGKRLQIDKFVAKTNFVLQHFFIHPKFFILDPIILFPWRMSCKNGDRWLMWHILFHGSAIGGMLLTS